MIDLMHRLRQQGLSVRELAVGLELPLKTVQDWVWEHCTTAGDSVRRQWLRRGGITCGACFLQPPEDHGDTGFGSPTYYI